MFGSNANAANAGQQSNPLDAYSQLAPSMVPQVAKLFMQHLGQTNDPQAKQFAQMNPNNVSPAMLAEMHQYAAQNHPGVLGQVMTQVSQHPQIATAIGAFAMREIEQHLGGQAPHGQQQGGFHL